jgi:hypothetical protein
MTEPGLAAAMQALALEAVEFARKHFDTDLDFSEASLEAAEAILGQLYDSLPMLDPRPSTGQVWQMSKMWGGYVGEVIRRRWGGEWMPEDPPQAGAFATLRIGAVEINPPARVYQRLTNGPPDNVWHYYQVLTGYLERQG